MNTIELIQYTGKNKDEAVAEHVNFGIATANAGFLGFLHTLLSDINGVKYYLEAWGRYLFPIAFGLKAADWLTTFWNFLQSSNKNLAKTNNLLLKSLTTAIVGLAIFGGVVIGAAMVPIVFTIAVALDVIVDIGKAIYYGAKALNSDEKT